ncbi:hypothetical protein SCCGRSA3_00020 [Marine Group I thaumarchaeote SCGC RSA3]|uniref:Uncharacterized protein n=2 Tax=Marine Group I TaxID=905826 RepID=A0A087RLP5_9ARCH|nr:hypothetical protein AAA799D11_01759 [Marine Group I thaumarchaeote SCGC AAA799-D11]KFM21013.1 hypothetical protein SCCGRSA3_00020 [Marine Group I thaumarchaeote SCGC RSA3]
MITILRRYYKCNFLDPNTFEVELEITVRITDSPKYILLPSGSYRGDLEVTDSSGRKLVIMSDKGYEQLESFSMKQINEKYIEKLGDNLLIKQKNELLKNHRVIAIMLPRTEEEYYDTIKMKWVTELENKKYHFLNEYMEIPLYFHRYGVLDTNLASIYLSIKTTEKYVIRQNLDFFDIISKTKKSHKVILNEDNHKIYRLDETEKVELIKTAVQITIPETKETWARTAFVSSLLVSSFLVVLAYFNGKFPVYSFEILSALIAFIIGQKIFLFQDLHLMGRWNTALMGAGAWCALLILTVVILQKPA